MRIRVDTSGMIEMLIPLYLISLAGRQFRGRTRLQKLVFLIQERLKKAVDYGFTPARLGPLSYQLYVSTERMSSLKLIKETTKYTSSGNTVVCFELTNEGKALLEFAFQKRLMTSSVRKAVEEVHNEYGSLPYVTLLDKVHKEYPEYVLDRIF